MPNSFSETTSTSWFSRMKNAFFGVLIGLLLIPGSMFLLFWNESRAINETHRLNSGEEIVVKDVSIESIKPDLQGKLVHVAGQLHSLEPVADEEFKLTRQGLRLKRHVEMFQWDEHIDTKTRKKIGGGRETTKTPTYNQGWHEGRINSENFKNTNGHINPHPAFKSAESTSTKVELGAFEFPNRLINSVNNWQNIPLDDAWLEVLPEEIKEHAVLSENQLFYAKLGTPDPSSPQIGDIKISFRWVPDSDITLISQQHENSFRAYSTDYGDLELMQNGKLSAEQVFQRAHSANTFWTWGLRLLGFILMGSGFCMIMSPLSTFVSILPFLENIAGVGIAIVGFGLAAILSAIVIAVAWIAVRPILGVSLLVLAGGIFAALWFFRSTSPPENNVDHGVELMN